MDRLIHEQASKKEGEKVASGELKGIGEECGEIGTLPYV